MNDFEQQILDALHALEVKVTEELGEIRGDLKAMKEKNESDHNAIRHLVEQNVQIDTHRLNKHSAEIDAHSQEIAKFNEWKEQYQKQVANRIAISQSISTIAAVVIAFLLSKFL
ncbi:MAG: hypothetical protein OXH00_26010 [Candidatus Poribacteria bacterium]|nr:hypothetical protein [Candidatus Poribacteria bacterium]